MPNIYLGDNLIFIKYRLEGNETPSQVKNIINTALRTYDYYTMNGETIVYVKSIYEWVTTYKGSEDRI